MEKKELEEVDNVLISIFVIQYLTLTQHKKHILL